MVTADPATRRIVHCADGGVPLDHEARPNPGDVQGCKVLAGSLNDHIMASDPHGGAVRRTIILARCSPIPARAA
jgi:hypothetical protein